MLCGACAALRSQRAILDRQEQEEGSCCATGGAQRRSLCALRLETWRVPTGPNRRGAVGRATAFETRGTTPSPKQRQETKVEAQNKQGGIDRMCLAYNKLVPRFGGSNPDQHVHSPTPSQPLPSHSLRLARRCNRRNAMRRLDSLSFWDFIFFVAGLLAIRATFLRLYLLVSSCRLFGPPSSSEPHELPHICKKKGKWNDARLDNLLRT